MVGATRSLEEIVYTSKLTRWDERATVRTHPRRVLEETDEPEPYFFSPALLPLVTHPLVARHGDQAVRGILTQQLFLYLDFTAELEHQAVNPICSQIARRRSGLALPEQMLADAHKIYTDEGWHAQFSDDLGRQVAAHTGREPLRAAAPAFLDRLAAARGEAPPRVAEWLPLLFAITSETLISARLATIPRDPRVAAAVRELVADHALDEGVHHAYFAKLIEFAWPAVSAREQALLAPRLPELVRAFLDPDWPGLAAILLDAGLSPDEAGQVLTDAYPDAEVTATARADARATLRHFGRAGILDVPGAMEAFAEAGLA